MTRDDRIIYVEHVNQCPFFTREFECGAPSRLRGNIAPMMHRPPCADDKSDELGADSAPPKDCPLRKDGVVILLVGGV